MTTPHSHSHQEDSAVSETGSDWSDWFAGHGIDPGTTIRGTTVTRLLDGRNRIVYARITEFSPGTFSPEMVWHQLDSEPRPFPGHDH